MLQVGQVWALQNYSVYRSSSRPTRKLVRQLEVDSFRFGGNDSVNAGLVKKWSTRLMAAMVGAFSMISSVSAASQTDPLMGKTQPEINAAACEDDGVRIPNMPLGVKLSDGSWRPFRPTEERAARAQHENNQYHYAAARTVYITNTELIPEASGSEPQISISSGWVCTHDGIIITNDHNIKDPDMIVIKFTDSGATYKGTVLALDKQADLAWIKIDPKNGEKFPTFRLISDSEILTAGQEIRVMGAPENLKGTWGKGMIATENPRIIEDGSNLVRIQHDAPVNPGSSGGPTLILVEDPNNPDLASLQVAGVNFKIRTIGGGWDGITHAIHPNHVASSTLVVKDGKEPERYSVETFISELEKIGIRPDRGISLPLLTEFPRQRIHRPISRAGLLQPSDIKP